MMMAVILAQYVLATATGATGPDGTSARAAPAGAVVLFDEAHFPVYTVNPANPSGYAYGINPDGAYAAFAGVLSKAGFTVRTLDYGSTISAGSLSGVKALVIVCSQGKDAYNIYAPAPYTGDEINAVVDFVRNGGGLFLIGDHSDFPPAIFPIASRFGISFGQMLLFDPTDHVENTTSGLPPEGDVFIVFGRDNFNDHPIMDNITRIELYRTDIFTGLPPEAQPLIISDQDTSTMDLNGSLKSAPRCIVSAAIPSNGTAGAGRIVVVADTNTFETAENRDSEDADMDLFDSDNELYGAQIVGWLVDIPKHFGVNMGSAEKDTLGQKSITHDCAAGSNTTFYLKVSNAGNVADSYDLSVDDSGAAGWVPTLNTTLVTLNSADARIFTLVVSVPAGAQVGASARFRLDAISRNDASISASMNCTVQVPALHNITLTCAENRKSVHGNQTATYDLVLANRGNVVESVEIACSGPPGWAASLDAASAKLEAASNRTVGLSVTPPAGALGGWEAEVVATAVLPQLPGQGAGVETYTRVIQDFLFRLSCPAPFQGVDPGSLVSFPVLVSNVGNGDDEISLALAGPSRWGAYLEPSDIVLPFNSTVQTAVVARAPEQAPAGERLELEVLGMSVREPSARANLSLTAVVNRIGKFRLQIEPFKRSEDPGSVAEFNVTVTNIGNAEETVLLETGDPASLSRKEVTVPPGGAAPLKLSYPVAADEPAGAQHFVEVAGRSSLNSSVWSSAGAVVVVNQLHRMQASLTPDSLMIPPGEEKNISLAVQNDGNGPEAVSAIMDRTPAGWSCRIESAVMALEAGGGREGRVSIGIPARTPAGIFGLILNLSYGTGNILLLPLTVEVPRIFGFTCSVMPASRTVGAGKEALFTLRLENLGNSPETITLTPAGARAAWIHPAENATLVNYSGGRETGLRVRPGPEAMPGKYRLVLLAAGEGNDTCDISLNLTVKEAATGTSDLPCLLGAMLVLAASTAAYLVRRKLSRASGATDDPKTPPKAH
jgi:uncharacterized membrane protein